MSKLDQTATDEILSWWHNHDHPTIQQVARELHRDRESIRRVLKQHNIKWSQVTQSAEFREKIEKIKILQDLIAPKLINRKNFTGDAIITADYHCPCTIMDLVHAVIKDARKHKIYTLYIVGDFFNMDVLSFYARKMGGDAKLIPMSDELNMGKEIILLLAEHFNTIIYSTGNHEARFGASVLNAFTFEVITNWLKIPKLQFLDSYWFYLDGIRVTHPKSYSQVKMSVASRLCDKYNCDVISAHGHFATTGFSRGAHRAIDLPVMADWERIAYMNKADTTHPLWNPGYLIYKKKQIYLRANGYGLSIA